MQTWLLNERYRLWRQVSAGPHGRVHLSEDRRRSAPVAVKLWHPPVTGSLGREIPPTFLSALDHPHLAPLLDFGRASELQEVEASLPTGAAWEPALALGEPTHSPDPGEESLFFVTPWYGGGDLFARAEAFLATSPNAGEIDRWLAGLCVQLLAALRYLHEHSLLHFDVSPRNILFDTEELAPGIPRAVLIDLELSQRDSTPLGTRVRGTFPFIAPEVLRESIVDPRADLYSLGASLYHALDRGRLTAELGPEEVRRRAEEGRLPHLRERVEEVPASWADRIERLIAPDPADRPASAADLLEEIRQDPALPPELALEEPPSWQPLRLVGLEREFDYLHREIEKLRHGESSNTLVLVGGETGIGRQAVAQRLRDRARLEGIRTIAVRCPGRLAAPLEPLAALLEQLARDPGVRGVDPMEVADLVRALRARGTEGDPALPPLPTVEEERARLVGRIGTVLEQLESGRGTLFSVEDLHRGSPELLEILGIVSHRLHSRREPSPEEDPDGTGFSGSENRTTPRILILCTYDDRVVTGRSHDPVDGLAAQSQVSRVTLKPLNRARARQVVQSTLGRSHLPAPVVDALHELSGGLTRRLLSLLRESHRYGLLRQERAGWIWTGTPGDAVALPERRADAYRSLTPSARTVLDLAEFAGGPTERGLLAEAASSLDVEEAGATIEGLRRDGWLGLVVMGAGVGSATNADVTPEGSAHDVACLRLELPIPRSDPEERPRCARALGAALLSRNPQDPTGAAGAFIDGEDWDSLARVLPRTLESLGERFALASLVELVDRIDERAPRGTLSSEALVDRAQALRDLGRDAEALDGLDALLDTLRESGPVPPDLSVLRAELLRRNGRLAAAHDEVDGALDACEPATPLEIRVRLLLEFARILRAEDLADRAHARAEEAVRLLADEPPAEGVDPVLELGARIELAQAQLARGWNERAAEGLEEFRKQRGQELDAPWLAHLLNQIAEIEYGRGRFDEALRHWRESLPLERRMANYASLATVVISLGRVAYARGDHRRATRLHRLSLRLREQIGDRRGVARALNNIGLLYKMQNRVEAAEACFRRCLRILEELGPPDDTAALLGNLSDVKVQQGDFPLALKYALQALEIRKPLGNRRGIAFAYYRIANIYRNQGELDRAGDFAEKSLELRRELGDRHNLVYSQKLLGDLHAARARYFEANRLLRQSLSLADTLGNRAGRCSLLTSIALLEARTGQLDAALHDAQEALTIATAEQLELYVGVARLARGISHLGGGELSEAEEDLLAAEDVFRREHARRELAWTLLERTELALVLGSVERGWPLLEEAYETIEELGLIDLQPMYYRLRGGLAASGSRADIAVARRLLERGLEESQGLDLPEETWRLHRDLARLEETAGSLPDAAVHLRQAAETLQAIHDRLPAQFRSAYLESGSRLELLAEWRARVEEPDEPAPAEPERNGAPATRGETEDLLRLQEVTLLLNSERRLQVLLDRILHEVLELFGAERGFLILLEDGEERIRAARDIDADEVDAPEFKYSHSIAREVLESGHIFLTNDAQHDRRLRESHSVHDLKLQAIACFPLVWRDAMLGVIYIENRFRKEIVPRERRRLLEAFSAQAAQAIANARLHDELVARSEDLERSSEEIEELNARLRDRVEEQDRELEEARRAIAEQQEQLEERYRFHKLIGSSEEMREVFRLLDRISATDLPVLIEGESGTGKELVARAIHYNSDRRRAAFISENCGAISETLFESELFGSVKGAFTGADRDHPGLFVAASGGTLFLDEIHQLSLASQRKLLRVLQEGEVRPVGSEVAISVDARILAASNEPLYTLVQEGRFREDLYYRLNVLRVELPPLHQRGRDILILAQHFLEGVVESQGLEAKRFSAESLRALARYAYPGNVRELRNVVEKAAILGEGTVIEDTDLFFDSEPGAQRPIGLPGALTEVPLREARDEFQRRYLERILDEAGGVVSHAAERAGVTRESLHRMIRKHGIRRP